MRYAISLQSVCNQPAISLQSACLCWFGREAITTREALEDGGVARADDPDFVHHRLPLSFEKDSRLHDHQLGLRRRNPRRGECRSRRPHDVGEALHVGSAIFLKDERTERLAIDRAVRAHDRVAECAHKRRKRGST